MTLPTRTKKSLIGLQSFISYVGQKYNTEQMIIMEWGSWTGASAKLFAKYFKRVICVDPFVKIPGTITERYDMKKVKEQFLKNVSFCNNIDYIDDFSYNLLGKDIKADIVYIDGDHHYDAVIRDIGVSIEMGIKIISGHDWWPKKFDGVISAVKKMLGKPDRIFSDTSWIVDLRGRR